MIIEYTNDGLPLWFSVKDGDGDDFGSNLLTDALYQAIQRGVDEIGVSKYVDGKEERIDTLQVDKVLKDYYSASFPHPLQYQYIKNGGIEYVE